MDTTENKHERIGKANCVAVSYSISGIMNTRKQEAGELMGHAMLGTSGKGGGTQAG